MKLHPDFERPSLRERIAKANCEKPFPPLTDNYLCKLIAEAILDKNPTLSPDCESFDPPSHHARKTPVGNHP